MRRSAQSPAGCVTWTATLYLGVGFFYLGVMIRSVDGLRYVMPFREGGSVPVLMEAHDLGLYVVKLSGAAQGRKSLIAELVSGELARALWLDVPELVFVDLDASLAMSEPDPELAFPLAASIGRNLGLD